MLTVEHADDRACKFSVVSSVASNLPNALRRSLLNDVGSFAPVRVVFQENTSCQTDEYVAHRICMIPFRCTLDEAARAAARSSEESCPKLNLDVSDRTAYASDLKGCGFVHAVDAPIMKMISGQRIRCEVEFAYGTAADHIRHSHIGPVAYDYEECKVARRGPTKRTTMSYETFVEKPLVTLDAGLGALEAHLERALVWVDAQAA